MADKLKECPFCGGEAEVFDYWNEGKKKYRWVAMCTNCKGGLGELDTKEEAFEKWNNRWMIPCEKGETEGNWHTGTPTEGGLYFVYDKYCGYAKRILKDDISKEQLELAFHDVVAWQKITPYEGEEQFPCGCCKCYEDKKCILLDAEVGARTRDERCPLRKEKN